MWVWYVVMVICLAPSRLDQDEEGVIPVTESPESSHPEVITMPSRFEKSQDKGYIDVWWLYDDGGECVLLCPLVTPPYRSSHTPPLLALSQQEVEEL